MKEIAAVVPFFFFDLIARIIPGSAFVWLYWPSWVESANSFGAGLMVLFAMWLAGLLLDLCGAWLGLLKDAVLYPVCEGSERAGKFDIFNVEPIDRRNSLLRVSATKICLRCLGQIFVLAAVLPSNVVGERPKLLHDHPAFIFLGIILVSFAWCAAEREYREQRKQVGTSSHPENSLKTAG